MIINLIMPERKTWTEEQDRVLKYLKEEEKMNKWSIISKRITKEYKMPGRTGKQCRQRYHNHLDSSIVHGEWTRQQQQYMYSLHNEIGNKWAIIAQKMPGRSDNCVKNHFYSKMRKAIRKLNKVIHENFKKEIKQIKMSLLYKIIEVSGQRFKNESQVCQPVSQKCCSRTLIISLGLKNMLLEYSNDFENQFDDNLVKCKELATEIYNFSLHYRKRHKRDGKETSGFNLSSTPKYEEYAGFYSEGENLSSDCSKVLSRADSEEEEEREKTEEIQQLLQVKEDAEDLKDSNSSIINKFIYGQTHQACIDKHCRAKKQVQKEQWRKKEKQKQQEQKEQEQEPEIKEQEMKASSNEAQSPTNRRTVVHEDQESIQLQLMMSGILMVEESQKFNGLSMPPQIAAASSVDQHGDDMDQEYLIDQQNFKTLTESLENVHIEQRNLDEKVVDEEDRLFVST